MGAWSIWHWVVVLVIILILFGPGKLPDVFKQAGRGLKAFKDASEGKDQKGAEPEADTEEAEVRAEIRRRREARGEIAQRDELDDEPAKERQGSAKRE